jgi:hypothetical protein
MDSLWHSLWHALSPCRSPLSPALSLLPHILHEPANPQAICFTQVLCQPPDPFTEVYNQYERLLYDCLDESAGSGAVSASAPAAA